MPTADRTLPTPSRSLTILADLPKDIQAAIEALSAPWPYEEIQIRPGAINREGTAAQALPYHDWWTGYLPRLNDLVGPNNFRIRLIPWGDDVIAHLRAFDGIIEGWSSGSAKQDKLGPMEAEAQAKKRVCAEKLMLGLYLYYLPTVWMQGEYDRERKLFFPNPGEEQRCAHAMYARCGLIPRVSPGVSLRVAPVTPRATAAAEVLRTAEQHAGVASAPVAATAVSPARPALALVTDPQLGLIAGLVHDLAQHADRVASIDAAGRRFGLAELSTLHTKDRLRERAATLTKLDASKLIDALKALETPPVRAA